MSYSVIGISCTLFNIVRSCSGVHGCQDSNLEADRIEMIIMDGKSEIIWAAESEEHPSKEGMFYAAIGCCNQAGMHPSQMRIHESATVRLYV